MAVPGALPTIVPVSLPASLLEVAEDLAGDEAAKAAFNEDPDGYLAAHGLDAFSAGDLATALEHVADALPPETAVHLPPPDPGAEAADLLGEVARLQPEATDLAFGEGDVDDDLDPDAEGDADVDSGAMVGPPDDGGDGPDDAGDTGEAFGTAVEEQWADDGDDDGEGEGDDEVDLDFGAGADADPDAGLDA